MKQEFPRTREGQMQKYARHCIHFNGIQHDQCEAGVTYLRSGDDGFVCFGEVSGCDKYQAKGIDAVKQEFAAADAFCDKVTLAREAILNELRRRFKEGPASDGVTAPRDTHRWNNKPQANYFCGQGKMVCPICKTGTLHYSRVEYNGHVHARCSTDKCVAWME